MRRPALPRRVVAPLAFVVLLTVVLVAWAFALALHAARSLAEAEDQLAAAQGGVASPPDVARALERARGLLDQASGDVEATPFRLVASMPLLGRSLAAERAVVRTAEPTVDGLILLSDASPTLRAEDGRVDVERLSRLAIELDVVASRAERELAALRRAPTGMMPAPVASRVDTAERALQPVVGTLRSGAMGAEVASGLLGGSGRRQLLVALENNAELRGTGGHVSTFATGVAVEGRLSLMPFRDVIEVNDEPSEARRVAAPDDYVEDYGSFLADTTHWRNWAMSADIPTSAAVGAAAGSALLDTTLDAVVLLDVPALGAIVRLHGEDIRLDDGTTLSPEDLERSLLVEEYARSGDPTGQDARRAALRDAATRTVSALLTDSAPGLGMVRMLGDLAAGRHLALWSARPEEQRRLVDLGLAGGIHAGEDDLTHVSVNNLNGTKLDYYVDRTVSVDVTVGAANSRVVQRVTLANRAPVGLVGYVEGFERPGEVVNRVELWLAADVALESLTVDGAPAPVITRQRPDRTLVATNVVIPRGKAAVVELTYTLPTPGGVYRGRLIPQALARDARLEVTLRAAQGALTDVEGAGVASDGVAREAGPWPEQRTIAATLAGG